MVNNHADVSRHQRALVCCPSGKVGTILYKRKLATSQFLTFELRKAVVICGMSRLQNEVHRRLPAAYGSGLNISQHQSNELRYILTRVEDKIVTSTWLE